MWCHKIYQQKSTRIDGWMDVVQAIDTAAPTNNEGNKDNISPVDFVDDEEVETETKRPVIIRFQTYQYQYGQQQKLISDFDIY